MLAIVKGAGIEDARIHDLRHTVKTGLASLGISKDLRDRIMNHSEQKKDVGDAYDHYSYDKEKRQALEAWANHLRAIVEGQETASNVVAIGKRSPSK